MLNVVTGTDPEAGQALVDHPQVDKLAFTGSEATGTRVMAAAARDIKRISLELGGKSPFVVFDDAVIEDAVEWIMFGIFWNQGQVCSATSRVPVQEQVFERVLDRLLVETRKTKIGPGAAPGVLLGPLVSQAQLDRVSRYADRARGDGARVRCGGRRVSELAPGYFFEPTVPTDVPLDSPAWREEIFGPVVCLRSLKDEAEAILVANDSPYGLAAAVMSADQGRAERVAGAVRAGIVWINCSQPTFTEAPWGGFKRSGLGRELGRWGLEAYLELKQITRYVAAEPRGWYIRPNP